MNFGEALENLKSGLHVARTGWNGVNMRVYLEDSYSVPIKAGVYAGTMRKIDPYLCLFTANGTHQPGWVPSQADILANDWKIVV